MTEKTNSAYIRQLCHAVTIMPVLVVDEVTTAKPLAQTLLNSGISILEVTLRTPAALEVIHEMSKIPGVVVAAGTIATVDDLKSAKQAGALFGVTPGTTHSILDAANAENFPLLPGVATVSEMMMALEFGYDFLKFFPAESAGGVNILKSFSGPFPDIKFCPTGGITIKNALDYLELKNVICVGGSWLAPTALINTGNWEKIAQLASESLQELGLSQ
jgi:2-dehydro-3-deoxyphosphogluconate aldolase/(4S)-4-hydroxy-2-oxoglutarate aldolase